MATKLTNCNADQIQVQDYLNRNSHSRKVILIPYEHDLENSNHDDKEKWLGKSSRSLRNIGSIDQIATEHLVRGNWTGTKVILPQFNLKPLSEENGTEAHTFARQGGKDGKNKRPSFHLFSFVSLVGLISTSKSIRKLRNKRIYRNLLKEISETELEIETSDVIHLATPSNNYGSFSSSSWTENMDKFDI
ncbi:predicted protein [Chaetoceros tenuissimus]|uniref:Uncharacterized protein n=1 Tax=Chaetoceros tenuissimus TaxID=426638 RepID=A0AAD3HEY1_9STRA|nr:predicted protein [Chaetoceros tenuissimus]